MITGGVNMGPWMGDDATRKIVAEMNRRVYAAAVMVSNHAKRLINREGAMGLKQLEKHIGGLEGSAFTSFRDRFNRNLASTSVKGRETRVRLDRVGRIRIGGSPGRRRRG